MEVDYQPVSYSEVFFREPESQADQNRMMSIVTVSYTHLIPARHFKL